MVKFSHTKTISVLFCFNLHLIFSVCSYCRALFLVLLDFFLISLSSSFFSSISTEFWAVPQLPCSNDLCLQQGRRSTFIFRSRFRQKLLSKQRLTFRSRSILKISFLSLSVVHDIPATRFTPVVTAFL